MSIFWIDAEDDNLTNLIKTFQEMGFDKAKEGQPDPGKSLLQKSNLYTKKNQTIKGIKEMKSCGQP